MQQAVDNNRLLHVLPEVKAGLDALRRILCDRESRGDKARLVNTQLVSSTADQAGFQLPPMQLAMLVI